MIPQKQRSDMSKSHNSMGAQTHHSTPKAAHGNITRRRFLVTAGASTALFLSGLRPSRAAGTERAKVGAILSEKGPFADDSKSLLAGFELFLKERGADFPPLELIKHDCGPKEENSLQALTELGINQKVGFLLGPLSLDASEKTIHGASGTELILFVNNPGVRLVAGELCLPGSFRLCPNTYQSSRPLVPWALENVGLKVFLTGNSDPLGNEQADFFAHGFERAGGKFFDRKMLQKDGGNLKEILADISGSDADFVFASLRGTDAISFVEAFKKSSPQPTQKLLGPESLTQYPATLGKLQKAASGVPTLTFLSEPKDLAARIKKALGTEVTNISRAAEGYDTAHVICSALKEAKGNDLKFEELIKIVEGISIEGPRGKVSFDKNHEPLLQGRVQAWELDDNSQERKILADLGTCESPDFGCGRVGFPKRPRYEEPEEGTLSGELPEP
ncbi:ABC transporter substrate-binding protein [Thermodesulfobacteriota bacterium]